MKMDANFYARRQAYDKGCGAAREYIVKRKAYPVTVQPSNPIEAKYEDEHAGWTDGFTETMRKHGGWQ